MISFQNVTKIYNTNHSQIIALRNISFEVKKGELVSIVGKSGAGKTTLLKLILKEEEPTEGKIYFEGEDITNLKKTEIYHLRRKMGVIFQDYKLLPSKTVYENVAYVLEVMGKSEAEIKHEVPQALEIVGLLDRKNSFPEELSGGEKQRVAIARALVHRPELILADEPTGNLDPYHTQEIIRLLNKINEMGTTVILATHHKEIINTLQKRVIVLENGEIVRDEDKGKFTL